MSPSHLRPVEPYPALLLENKSERVLVVADLHIGWEVSLAQKGIHVPSQTPKLLEKIIQLINVTNPTSIVFLGDVKHTVEKVELEEWRDVPEFFQKISERVQDVQVVSGNHDGNLEALTTPNIRIHPASGITLWDSVGLIHGHAWPRIELLRCEHMIMAHLHPVVTFTDELGYRMTRQVWVKARLKPRKLANAILKNMKSRQLKAAREQGSKQSSANFTCPQCIVMPSFNENLGGRSVNRSMEQRRGGGTLIGPVLRSSAVDFDNAELHLLDGTYLGTVKHLRSISRS